MGPKEHLRNIPPGDFLQGTILVEITAIILQPSRWLPASFRLHAPLRAWAIAEGLRFSGEPRV
jgi:hypothetical protein